MTPREPPAGPNTRVLVAEALPLAGEGNKCLGEKSRPVDIKTSQDVGPLSLILGWVSDWEGAETGKPFRVPPCEEVMQL